MWRVLGVLAILSAIWGVGWLVPTTDEKANVAVNVGIATQGNPHVGGTGAADLYAPSTSAPSFATPAATGTGSTATAAWATTVTPAANAVEPVLDEAARIELVMALQRELRRIGCYRGRISGTWSKAARKAAAAFAERLSITSASGEPDTALLQVASRMQNRACGTPCAAGQRPNAQGKCKPIDLIADGAGSVSVAGDDSTSSVTKVVEPAIQKPAAEEQGPIVVASLSQLEAEIASLPQDTPGAVALAGSEPLLDEPDDVPQVKATRKRKTARKAGVPDDAFAPVTGSAGSIDAQNEPFPAPTITHRKKRTVIASLGGGTRVVVLRPRQHRQLNRQAYGLGVASQKRVRAPSNVRQARASRRVGFAASLRNRLKEMNGGSLR